MINKILKICLSSEDKIIYFKIQGGSYVHPFLKGKIIPVWCAVNKKVYDIGDVFLQFARDIKRKKYILLSNSEREKIEMVINE